MKVERRPNGDMGFWGLLGLLFSDEGYGRLGCGLLGDLGWLGTKEPTWLVTKEPTIWVAVVGLAGDEGEVAVVGLAGDEGDDLVGLKPGGAFHISCNIFKFFF